MTGFDYVSNTVSVKFARAEQPEFREFKGTNRYMQFGKNNDYPEYLLSLYNESAKHGAIIRGKAKYIVGSGFEGVPETSIQWNKLLKRAALDGEMFGGYYFQLVFNRMGQLASVYHIDYSKVRVNKDLTEFYVKEDWKDSKEKMRAYPAFNSNGGNTVCMIFRRRYEPGLKTYPSPPYRQALNYIESDVQVSRHILGNAKDGFVGGTLINLNNGDPISEENKGEVERALKRKFTGSEGDRLVIVFNKSKDNSAEIVPLGNTQLTKEDFTNINKLIEQEIFAGHEITSPALFGIKTEGQLGGRNELRMAYEIFNNTYINARQVELEQEFQQLFDIAGVGMEANIKPVQPLGFEFSEAIMSANMTREEIREMMGLEAGLPQQPGVPGDVAANSIMTNLTGRQLQSIQRTVRKYTKGELTKEQAASILKSGYGMTNEDVALWLGSDDDPTTPDGLQFSDDDTIIAEFEGCGEDRSQFEVMDSVPVRELFEDEDYSRIQSNVLDLISKDKRITPEVIAETLDVKPAVVSRVINLLVKRGLLKTTQSTIGQDTIVERELTKPMADIRRDGDVTTTEILIRYSYEGPDDDRRRPFCVRMMEISKRKMWTRTDIENISMRLGYSVWDRRGGWYTEPDGTRRPYCRHDWKSNIVLRKKSK